jgi:Ca2+-binding RTX toxin-like protein
MQGSALDDGAVLGHGSDWFRGYDGDDTCAGMGGHDEIWGDGGNDLLNGGAGRDGLHGGQGLDTMTGGAGADRFVFRLASSFGDVISDFASGVDSIRVHSRAVADLLPLGAVDAAHFHVDVADGTGAQFVWDTQDPSGNGMLYFDADGSGAGAAVLVAVLTGLPELTGSDLVISL